MFVTAHSPDISEKARPPQGPAVGLRLQKRYGSALRRSGITGIWQIPAGNNPAFVARTRFGTDLGQQVLATSDFAIPLTTVRPVLRGTGP